MAEKKVIVGSGKQKPEKEDGPRLDESLMKPGSYEITYDHVFEIDLHLKPKNGRWVVMTGPGEGVVSHKVVFRLWTYDEMIDMRKRATNYDQGKRIHMVDQDLLNRMKIQALMMSWTLSDENPRLKLIHRQGVLVDESWTVVKKLQPNILQYIINEMNEVYEHNG